MMFVDRRYFRRRMPVMKIRYYPEISLTTNRHYEPHKNDFITKYKIILLERKREMLEEQYSKINLQKFVDNITISLITMYFIYSNDLYNKY